MADIQRLTITLPNDMTVLLREVVDEGGYASTSEVIREALRDWKQKKELHDHKIKALKADIDRGLADLAEGRTREFQPQRVIQRGRKLLAKRVRSA